MIPSPPNIASGFELLETMKVSEDGTIHLLRRHLERLRESARYFGFACYADELRQAIVTEAARQPEAALLRLLLSRDGTHELQVQPLPAAGHISSLRLSPVTVNSADPFLYHKTTARGIYEQARGDCDTATDVLLTNQHCEITEITIANIAVFRKGRWVTPMVSSGLLPGTMRAHLLAEGQLVEGAIRSDELLPGETVRCFNAVRGVFDVPFR